jgi:hypothetical protein
MFQDRAPRAEGILLAVLYLMLILSISVMYPCFAQSADPFLSAPAPSPDPFRSAPVAAPPKTAPRTYAPRRPEPAEPVLVPRAAYPAPVDPEIAAWQGVAQSTDVRDFEAYLVRFPQGRFAEAARTRLAALRPQAPPAAPMPSSPNASPAGLITPGLRELRRTVARETERHVASSWNSSRTGGGTDCVGEDVPELTISSAPQHGAVRFVQTEDKPGACPNRIRVMGVFYKAHPGFTGQDQFTYERKGNWRTNGLDRYVRVIVTVQ